ncbi:MAG: TIGR03089 family protein [Actinomycetes bacterium]
MSLTEALLGPLLRADAAAPRVTYYDDATGERVELSGATLANWAAKSANLLRAELDVEPGGRVAVLLPAHWQTVAALLGVWWCGAEVVADPSAADVVLADAEHLGSAVGAGDALVAGLSLDAFGRGLDGLPAGVLDFAVEVRLQPDEFVVDGPVPASAAALAGAPADDVLAAARARAAELGLVDGDRVLSTLDWPVPDGVLDGLLTVLAVGGSLVQCRHADPAALERRAQVERATARLG